MTETAQPQMPELLQRLAGSARLRQRRLDMLPLRGPGAVFTEAQGRAPGDSTVPENLADLISSIASVGLLQPVLVEELRDGLGPPRLRLVSGERRLRAIRWGAVHDPDNPQFAALPAVICPGPLSASERRIWQLVENVAREDLQPGELAAALLLERCAIATAKLLAAGRPVPADVPAVEDPVDQWRALEKLRGRDTDCAAPWTDVLRRLGLQLSPRKARQLVQAFAALPRDISEEMDAAKVALHTRITFVKLRQGRQAAAEEIWAAVKQRHRADLLPAAIQTGIEQPALAAGDAIDAAETLRVAANQARADKLRKPATAPSTGAADGPESKPAEEVTEGVVADMLKALQELLAALRAGKTLKPYDKGSVHLALTELRKFVEPEGVDESDLKEGLCNGRQRVSANL